MSHIKTNYNSIGSLSSFFSPSTEGGFSPADIPGLSLWLDATDPMNDGILPADGTSLEDWIDKSGNGNSATQPTGSAQPVFNLNVQNGKPAVAFSNSNMFGLIAGVLGNPSFSIFLVFKTVSVSVTQVAFGFGIGAGNYQSFGTGINTNTFNAFQWAGHAAVFSPANFNFNYTSVLENNVTNQPSLWVNGSPQTSSAGAPGALNVSSNYNIGSHSNGVGFNFLGNICEAIFYNQEVTDPQRLLLEDYLKTKWGL